MKTHSFAVMLFCFAIQASAQSYSERFLQFHRDWTIGSTAYSKAIASELGIPLKMAQDFLTPHYLCISETAFEYLVARYALKQQSITAANMVKPLHSLLVLHRLGFWSVSAYEYLRSKPMAFATNVILYQLLYGYGPAEALPVTTLHGRVALRTSP